MLIAALLLAFALAGLTLRRRFPRDPEPLVDHIDALLPQTQCAQCGYPGCRPYAQAIAAHAAPLNLCPPGGAALHAQLQSLMAGTGNESPPMAAPAAAVAVIDETQCIGCALCLAPCPVDAIVGAPGFMHTVIREECTGCELCVPACPVDCIDMTPLSQPSPRPRRKRHRDTPAAARACIHCGRCDPVCPVGLAVEDLFTLTNLNEMELAERHGLSRCIDCGLCDRACPSEIPLAQIFFDANLTSQEDARQASERRRLKQRSDDHNRRLAAAVRDTERKRRERLSRTREWS